MKYDHLFTELSKERLVSMYESMLRVRYFEEKVYFLFLEGVMPGTIHQCTGQEAVGVGVCAALTDDDVIASNHRSHGHSIAKGLSSYRAMAELMAKEDGCCKGKGGSMHFTEKDKGVFPATAVIGESILLATGAGLAFRLKKQPHVAAGFFGDGGSNIGSFHEGVNMGAVWKLPVLYVCENNQYAASTTWREFIPVEHISERAASYNIPGETVDGMDVLAVYEAAKRAVDRARNGDGPTLLEAVTYRYSGHSRADSAAYRPKEEVREWKARDAIKRFAGQLVEKGVCTADEITASDKTIEQEIEDAYHKAQNAPAPDVCVAEEDVL
ncbi:MAG: thiamine pyrophosphate-dependent dehydrogenase E1 component subunit alpha [Planctomycetaceae bacterium]|nr:thiamine pyrophosphate-dependent dehydrogenase E1 component subunit alpha [Planctomycetaceae bacterium]